MKTKVQIVAWGLSREGALPVRREVQLGLAFPRPKRCAIVIAPPPSRRGDYRAAAGDPSLTNDVRRSLQASVDFAEVHGCAMIWITHFAQGGAGKAP